jgi:hypothetical protein
MARLDETVPGGLYLDVDGNYRDANGNLKAPPSSMEAALSLGKPEEKKTSISEVVVEVKVDGEAIAKAIADSEVKEISQLDEVVAKAIEQNSSVESSPVGKTYKKKSKEQTV